MNFYSLNGKSPSVSFKDALIRGLAPDKGLYFPEKINKLTDNFINNIENYSNQEISSIYELYDFKRKLINLNLINAVRNDESGAEDIIVDFTPIKLFECYRENYLFPPKSTWISPRI